MYLISVCHAQNKCCPLRPSAVTRRVLHHTCQLTCRVWLAFLANTVLITGPLVLAHNPVSTLKETASEAKSVRSGRGKLFLILAAFFFVEGLGILAHPTLAQRVSHPPIQSGPRCLFQKQGRIFNSSVLCAGCIAKLLLEPRCGAEEVAVCKPVHTISSGSGCIWADVRIMCLYQSQIGQRINGDVY